MPQNKMKYRNPRRTMPGQKLPDHATKAVEDKGFGLAREREFTGHAQFQMLDEENALSGMRGFHINKLSEDDIQAHGISLDVEGIPRWEIIADGATDGGGWGDFGIWDNSGNDEAGGYVMRVSPEINATTDVGFPKFWFGRDASTPADENVAFTFYAGDEVTESQGMRITHFGGVNDNALGLLNRNPAINTCRFNFNTLWIMGTDILGSGNTDYYFFDNVNNVTRIYIKADSNPFPKIGIGSLNPQAALSVLLDINAAANTIQRVLHSQINNDPTNQAINIETIRQAGVAIWNYLWLNGTLGSSSTVGTRTATNLIRPWGWESGADTMAMVSAPSGTNQTIVRPFKVDVSGGNYRIGVFNVTPQARPTAYTQTYSTADRTMANLTAAALTHSVGTADGTVDDVGAAFDQTTLNNNFKELTDQVSKLLADITDVKQGLNSVIDDLQGYGWLQ